MIRIIKIMLAVMLTVITCGLIILFLPVLIGSGFKLPDETNLYI